MFEDGLGLPKRSRQDDATALTGFQSATTRSQEGMPWVGTKVLETNTRGRKKMKPTAAAASGFFTSIPAQAPTHVMANAISRQSPNAMYRIADSVVDSPADRQTGDDEDDNGDDLGEEVCDHTTGQDSGPGDGERTEPIGETRCHIGGNANRRTLGGPDKSHPEHAADEVLVVVATPGKPNCRTEDVDEEQNEDEWLHGDIEEL